MDDGQTSIAELGTTLRRCGAWLTQRLPGGQEEFTAARWVFLRALGLIFLIAFVSLWTQLEGLIGRQGVLPAAALLEFARQQLGPERYQWLPTLCWLNASDAFLHGLCAAGVLLSLLLILDVAPALALCGLWAAYLSLAVVGQDFLSFQWDTLLLETGFLAIFLAPWRLRPRRAGDAPPSRLALALLWWLLFRLIFSSGVVKLASHDPAWRHLTALTYHYDTQPLPPWTAWHAHHLPAWVQRLSCLVMFVIELVVPWLIVGPRRLRYAACGMLVGFQLLIVVTGNYCFFNWLAIALCLLLLDDRAWPGVWRGCCKAVHEVSSWTTRVRGWLLAPLVALVAAVTVLQVGSQLGWRRWPGAWQQLVEVVSPWRTINSYGLFAVMTTSRYEIVLEGSDDGERWQAYEFNYKPGDPSRRPRFVAPHQPRLDWQMWFAALGTYRQHPWVLHLCQRLLEGSPPVLRLLASNPFPGRPPRYVRAVIYEYQFSTPAERSAHGVWWQRRLEGLYCPVVSLHGN